MSKIHDYTYTPDQPVLYLNNIIISIYPYMDEVANSNYKKIILNYIDPKVLQSWIVYEVFANEEHTHIFVIFAKNQMVKHKIGIIDLDNSNVNLDNAIEIAVNQLGISLFDAQNYYEFTICELPYSNPKEYTLIISPK